MTASAATSTSPVASFAFTVSGERAIHCPVTVTTLSTRSESIVAKDSVRELSKTIWVIP